MESRAAIRSCSDVHRFPEGWWSVENKTTGLKNDWGPIPRIIFAATISGASFVHAPHVKCASDVTQ